MCLALAAMAMASVGGIVYSIFSVLPDLLAYLISARRPVPTDPGEPGFRLIFTYNRAALAASFCILRISFRIFQCENVASDDIHRPKDLIFCAGQFHFFFKWTSAADKALLGCLGQYVQVF